MAETVIAWDKAVFRVLNHELYWRPAADAMFALARDPLIVLALVGAIVVYARNTGWRWALPIALWSLAAVALVQILHNLWLKPWFMRPRPFLVLLEVHLCAPLGNLAAMSASFPSTHTASAAALAMVAAGSDRRLRGLGAGLATTVGLGTVYTGGHYPCDVIVGLFTGMVVGLAMLVARRLLRKHIAWM